MHFLCFWFSVSCVCISFLTNPPPRACSLCPYRIFFHVIGQFVSQGSDFCASIGFSVFISIIDTSEQSVLRFKRRNKNEKGVLSSAVAIITSFRPACVSNQRYRISSAFQRFSQSRHLRNVVSSTYPILHSQLITMSGVNRAAI